jgi:class 3 adenylate cyclase/tetratricopeptide (TPR) repeat protein
MIRKGFLLLFVSLLGLGSAKAQGGDRQKAIDSLKTAFNNTQDDTGKVNIGVALGKMLVNYDPKEALKYALPAAELAEKLHWKSGMATAYNTTGACYKGMADYPTALNYYFKSLKMNEELGNKEFIGRTSGNIGNVYRELHNYPKALEYLQKSLTINEALGRKTNMSDNYSDMGIVYAEQGNNKKALENFNKALAISEEAKDKEGEAIVYGNIGNIYQAEGSYKEAIDAFSKSVSINREIGREVGVAINTLNLGVNYYEMALDTGKHKQNLSPAEKDAALTKAIAYINETSPVFLKIGATDNLASTYKYLSDIYAFKKDYKNAFSAYLQFQKLTDSINSNDKRLKLANLTTERAEYEKQQQAKLTDLAQRKRTNETILFALVVILLISLVGYVVRARRKSERLLLNILPAEVAAELKEKGTAAASHFDEITVFFTDFVNFTAMSEKMKPQAVVDELDTCFKAFDTIVTKYRIEKIKTIGDAYMAVAGLPQPDPMHAVNAVRAAMEILEFVKQRKEKLGNMAFDIRIGLDSGSVVAGIVGLKKFAYDIWGDAVNTAARMEQNSEPGKINVSQTTYELIKDHFVCTYRGELEAKNKGKLKMYFVERAI